MRHAALIVGWVLSAQSWALGQAVDYEREVKPLLKQRCFVCHGAFKQQAQLRLDTGDSIRRGGASGPAVVAGDVGQSLLPKVVTGEAGFRMPPEGEGRPLSEAEAGLLRRWIEQGANSPADEEPEADPKTFWSYQPVVRPAIPSVANAQWTQNPIDAFIAAEHQKHGLRPRGPAPAPILLRRVYLDLIGLPPTRAELQAFLADESPGAYERVVDRLLADPRYGQRWGRHWMDVWRYSDWYGSRAINEIRYSQRHIWRWRDWIVESLNDDRGYDRMLHEMLAGDELAPGDPAATRATGFLGRNWYKFDRNVWMFEAVEQTAQAFMGMTLKCCRCHDHKFDPLTQQDYYRFRAFFEPHDVRTDPVSGELSTEKDATLGMVLNHGVSQVYDKQVDAKTYLFMRGDNRYPDESQQLSPGTPAALGVESGQIEAVALPPAAWFPVLQPAIVEGLRAESRSKVAQAETAWNDAKTSLDERRQQLAAAVAHEAAGQPPSPTPFGQAFSDQFQHPREDAWTVVQGDWRYGDGRLTQSNPGSFQTMVSRVTHPRDFMARIRYRSLEAGDIHSVGFFFDVVGLRDCQAVYTATTNTASSVQAFHRLANAEHYPAAGVAPWPIKIGQDLTVDIAARGALLNVWVNGELAIAYSMPSPRQDGAFALWTHSGSAEFYELLIDPLPGDFRLAQHASEKIGTPFAVPDKAELERWVTLAERQRHLAEKQLAIAQAAQQSLELTIAAEQARLELLSAGTTPSPEQQAAADGPARQAAVAQRQVAVLKAELETHQAEQALADAQAATYAADEARQKALAEAQQKLDAAKTPLNAALDAAAKQDALYEPLGPVYPQTSTGRRTALARWLTDARHPRTARVAANHIWLRHFGEALVPTVANFGMNGQRPSHPALLDWLSAELMDGGWRMKPLHRLLVTSNVYRMSSSDGEGGEQNRGIDPANRYLWRMNSRRMEAEVVRDSVLHLAGRLDPSAGGPELVETSGEQSNRRSMYFRNTPNEKMVMLELFDVANPNECYRRLESVVPQQALALSNSLLSMTQAQEIASSLLQDHPELTAAGSGNLVGAAFETLLSRPPSAAELAACEKLLARYATKNGAKYDPVSVEMLVHVLLNHNDFVAIR